MLDWVQNQKEFSASTKDIAAARVRAGSAEQYPGQRKYVDMYGYPNGKDPRFLVRREHGIYELYVAVKVAKKSTTTKKRSATRKKQTEMEEADDQTHKAEDEHDLPVTGVGKVVFKASKSVFGLFSLSS